MQGKMMNDSALVTLDFFRRLGLVSPQHPLAEYLQSFQSTGVEAV
ncbi:hypothetical protein [Kingella potus]|nr:hypothetical protein [Kingella potus]